MKLNCYMFAVREACGGTYKGMLALWLPPMEWMPLYLGRSLIPNFGSNHGRLALGCVRIHERSERPVALVAGVHRYILPPEIVHEYAPHVGRL